MEGMRVESREADQTTSARIKKKSKSTSGEIQRICFDTWITRPHCAQLIL